MIKRQISFLFEDPGFCIDVFCTIAEPVRYYNRDTESGAWYSSTPDWNENGSLIREDLIFEVIADGVVCALDGNGNFEGKKPFVPFCQFRQSLVQSVHVLNERRQTTPGFCYHDRSGWRAYPQTYMTMQCPLWIIAEDAATGRRLWITQEGPRFSISIRRMDEQRHNYGPTYRITCENRTKLAQVLRYQFESKTLAV